MKSALGIKIERGDTLTITSQPLLKNLMDLRRNGMSPLVQINNRKQSISFTHWDSSAWSGSPNA